MSNDSLAPLNLGWYLLRSVSALIESKSLLREQNHIDLKFLGLLSDL